MGCAAVIVSLLPGFIFGGIFKLSPPKDQCWRDTFGNECSVIYHFGERLVQFCAASITWISVTICTSLALLSIPTIYKALSWLVDSTFWTLEVLALDVGQCIVFLAAAAAYIEFRFGAIIAIPFYAFASLVGVMCIIHRHNFIHDAIAGSGLGIAIAWIVSEFKRKPKISPLVLSPELNDTSLSKSKSSPISTPRSRFQRCFTKHAKIKGLFEIGLFAPSQLAKGATDNQSTSRSLSPTYSHATATS